MAVSMNSNEHCCCCCCCCSCVSLIGLCWFWLLCRRITEVQRDWNLCLAACVWHPLKSTPVHVTSLPMMNFCFCRQKLRKDSTVFGLWLIESLSDPSDSETEGTTATEHTWILEFGTGCKGICCVNVGLSNTNRSLILRVCVFLWISEANPTETPHHFHDLLSFVTMRQCDCISVFSH